MRTLPIAAALALAAAGFAAFAQDPASTPAEDDASGMQATTSEASDAPAPTATTPTAGDAARGRMLTYTCQGCHGIEGYKNAYPNFHVPKIGGQSAAYLANALTEYKEGSRQHPTMQAQAQSFSEQDIADIAAFLSSLKP
ncbi:c-type cytochrome [Luteimonas pelagia]